jgi:hypothetical protein
VKTHLECSWTEWDDDFEARLVLGRVDDELD